LDGTSAIFAFGKIDENLKRLIRFLRIEKAERKFGGLRRVLVKKPYKSLDSALGPDPADRLSTSQLRRRAKNPL
jgi:hypothetical protein